MADGLDEEVERRFKEIEEAYDTESVAFPDSGYVVSDTAKSSHSYADCNAVVLLAPGYVGLSHYNLDESAPEDYLPSMIEEMRSLTSDNVTAVLIGGDPGHLERNREILEGEGITVIGEKCDGWIEQDRDSPNYKELPKGIGYKKIVATADTNEVFMHSNSVGYLRLTPIEDVTNSHEATD